MSSNSAPAGLTLAGAAAKRLAAGVPGDALAKLWLGAALGALAGATPCDPDGAALRAMTNPDTVWSGLHLADAERLQERIGRLRDCHHLAIINEDTQWLSLLARCWAQAPDVVGPWWPLRAHGEITLGMGRAAGSALAWNADDIEALLEESILSAEAPSDHAWLALAAGDHATARAALVQYEARLAHAMHAWQRSPEMGLRCALSHPGAVLKTELRALQSLLNRDRQEHNEWCPS
jgi:hypothetical protein